MCSTYPRYIIRTYYVRYVYYQYRYVYREISVQLYCTGNSTVPVPVPGTWYCTFETRLVAHSTRTVLVRTGRLHQQQPLQCIQNNNHFSIQHNSRLQHNTKLKGENRLLLYYFWLGFSLFWLNFSGILCCQRNVQNNHELQTECSLKSRGFVWK